MTDSNKTDFKQQAEAYFKKMEKLADPNRFKRKRRTASPYVSFNRRSFAFMVDFCLFLIPLYYPLYKIAEILFGHDKADFFYFMGSSLTQEQKVSLIMSPTFLIDLAINNFLSLILAGIPFFFLCIKYGNTPGMWLTRIRVVDDTLWTRPSRKQWLLRFAGWFLPVPLAWLWLRLVPAVDQTGFLIPCLLLMLGYMWLLVDRRNQTWHDKLSHTLVVYCKHWSWEWRYIPIPEGFAPVVELAPEATPETPANP